MNTHIEGVKGENIAARYLQKHKYKILERNFRCRYGEIDIIAVNGNFVCFIEVKTRGNDKFGLPRESVTDYKRQKIVRVANYWQYRNDAVGMPVRFDVVEVMQGEVNIIKDAFRIWFLDSAPIVLK